MSFVVTGKTRSLYGRFPAGGRNRVILDPEHPLNQVRTEDSAKEGLEIQALSSPLIDPRIVTLKNQVRRRHEPDVATQGAGVFKWQKNGHDGWGVQCTTTGAGWGFDGNPFGETAMCNSLWVQGTRDTNNPRILVGHSSGSQSYCYLMTNAASGESLRAACRQGADQPNINSTNSYAHTANEPIHLFQSVHKGDNFNRLYVNGLEVANLGLGAWSSWTGAGGTDSFYIINEGDSSEMYWHCQIWLNKLISPTQVYELWHPNTRYNQFYVLDQVKYFLSSAAPPVTAAKPPSGLALLGTGV